MAQQPYMNIEGAFELMIPCRFSIHGMCRYERGTAELSGPSVVQLHEATPLDVAVAEVGVIKLQLQPCTPLPNAYARWCQMFCVVSVGFVGAGGGCSHDCSIRMHVSNDAFIPILRYKRVRHQRVPGF